MAVQDHDRDYNPRDHTDQEWVLDEANRILSERHDIPELRLRERRLLRSGAPSLRDILALRLARSSSWLRRELELEPSPLHMTIVFAVYRETGRLVPPDRHPHGEDLLVRKIRELEWLLAPFQQVTWEMLVVDDGCPDGSAALARDLLAERCPTAPVRVLELAEAIERGDSLPFAEPLTSTDESRKGGSIVYGLLDALGRRDPDPRHILVYTDADLSTHLGQVGLLVRHLARGQKVASAGTRRHRRSAVVKEVSRDRRGRLFIYLWKGLLRPISFITDTQCGFKAFPDPILREILRDLVEPGFAFDMELLLRAETLHPGRIARVPIVWIDSDEASTTAALAPYLHMLKAAARMYRADVSTSPEADALAGFIERLEPAGWRRLMEVVPAVIAEGDPGAFGRKRPVRVADLELLLSGGEVDGSVSV